MNATRYKIFVLLFLITSFSRIAQAQDTWSLEKCIDYAVKNNIQIKQTALNSELAKTNLTQSEVGLLPSVNANASNYYNFGKTIDQFTNTFATEQVRSDRYSIQGNVTLFNGLQSYNTIKQNQLNLKASIYDTKKMVNDISIYIASAYLQILFDMELLDITNQQLLLTKAQVDRTQKLVDAGSVAKGNLLNVQSQAATEELQVVTAQNNLDIAYLNLTQLLELKDVKGFKISRPALPDLLGTEMNETVESVYQIALANQPEIKSAEIKLQSAQKGISIARGSLSPNLSFGGSYGTGYSGASRRFVEAVPNGEQIIGITNLSHDFVSAPTFTSVFEKIPYKNQFKDNINKSLGFSLSVPIFNGFQVRSAISRAKINTENAQINLEAAQKQLFKSIQQSYADAQGALKKFSATQKSVAALQESFKYNEQRYNVGMLNPLEYSDAKTKLAKAESDLVQAKYDYVFKHNILNFYQGKPISF